MSDIEVIITIDFTKKTVNNNNSNYETQNAQFK